MSTPPIRALFINSGILGQRTFARFVDDAFVRRSDGIEAAQTVVADGLTIPERLVRRGLCVRLWPDGLAGIRNLDRARFRAELNAGLVARRRIDRLERAARRRFDVLHFHMQATAYASVDRMRQTPSVVSIDCTQGIVTRKASSAAERRSYDANIHRDGQIFAAARLIVPLSQWAADCLHAEYPDCRTPVAVMPNPVQLDAFDPSWAELRHRRAATPGYKPVVLFVGGDFERKGGQDLLAAWRKGRFSARATLHIVSDGRIDTRLEEGVTRSTGIGSYSPRWHQMWRDADVFALPTRDDAFGLVFQEAAAAGLPAIGTNLNAIPELVADGTTGILVPRGSREALVGALDRLISAAGDRRTMGERARTRVASAADPAAYREWLHEALLRVSRAEGTR